MKKVFTLMLVAALALGGGCRKYDTNALWDELYSQAQHIVTLDAWQAEVNNNIVDLQKLVTELENGRYITDVEEIPGEPAGWRITFSSGEQSSITIRNGATPQIGVAEEDGVYYWTLGGDGVWLHDGDGNRIPVAGDPQGAKGDPGITPQLRINEDNNEWEVCVTGECTDESEWSPVLDSNGDPVPATGPQGGAIASVDNTNDDYVVFTLAGGNTTIQVPKYKPIGITFDQPETFMVSTTQTVPYTLTGAVQLVKVVVVDVPQGWTVRVTQAGAAGSFTITAPSSTITGEALVMVAGAEQTLTRVLQLPFPPTYAASTQEWTFGSSPLVWSDAIQIPGCNKDDFDGGDSNAPKADGRSYTDGGKTYYYYSWPYVDAYATALCPAPWRVPTQDDFAELATATNSYELNGAWGGGGSVGSNSDPYDVDAYGFYWSSTESSTPGRAYSVYFGNGQLIPRSSDEKSSGFQVRCVK